MIDPTLSASLSMIQAAPCSGWKDVFKRSGLSYIIKALAPEKTLEETKKIPRETEVDDMRKTCQELKKTDVQLQWLWEGILDKTNIYYLAACLQLVNIHLGSSRHTSLVSNPWE